MNNFLKISDIGNLKDTVKEAIDLKDNPTKFIKLGKNKTIALLFFNASLRTRLSTQKAAINLGMSVVVMNFTNDSWQLEFEDGVVMNKDKSEHIKEAAKVIAQYCDIVAVRAFASLKNKEKDKAEMVINGFKKYVGIPIINMESATAHPLQTLADAITIEENKTKHKPKVVLSWAPHPKALPHAVANSFVEMMHLQDADFVITHPEGYELDNKITKNSIIEYNQEKAFENADFVYVKNWSSFTNYGQVLKTDLDWMITADKMKFTNNAKFMHCLPVRRNVVVTDEVLDSENSIVIQQVNNRTYATQIVLKKILESL
ncbi:N-acetylornithine carbamoyltransferase [Lutibacter sp.]|uniref:N-acetylornithine carbamoyltransferase n=1 Tax=Lutibacter sp. TaxID=1925666 RepID=UPI0025C54A7E|nr:N-acetylornithine carbamoyltransferase [Lutibacter sp.]MCF6180660.1 N-acetylornithine carbamoyltransferase [Lutibacter sp.]